MEGYIKLHRAILSWERYQDTNTKVLFIHILLKACFDQCNYQNFALSKGQYLTSISKLADELNLSVRNVRTSLEKLQKSGEILVDATNKHSLITVVKYEDYQIATEPIQITKSAKKETKAVKQSFAEQCLSNSDWLNSLCYMYQATPQAIKEALQTFDLHLKSIDREKDSIRDYKEHFANWIRYNKAQLKKSTGSYAWKWKGQSVKRGTFAELEVDRKSFDHPGFEFEIISNGN